MSSRPSVAAAARIVVLTIAPFLFWFWATRNPIFGLFGNYDFHMKVIAGSLLAVSTIPLLTRLRRSPFRDSWTIPDGLLLVGILVLMLYILSGEGRAVDYGSEWVRPAAERAPATGAP